MPALEARGLSRAFGGVRAVWDVSFEVPAGSITAIVGPNGAGKTTLFNLLTNFYLADTGSVRLFGTELRGRTPDAVARLGLLRTFQTARVFPGMSVLDNVLVGAHLRVRSPFLAQALRLPSVRAEERSLRARAVALLDLVGLAGREDAPATTLPIGEQKLLELARALMPAPRVVLLDEPAAGLNDAETEELADVLLGVRAANVTVVVVEHNMPLVMSIADHIVVLDAGQLIAAGDPARIRSDPRVIQAYLGQAAV